MALADDALPGDLVDSVSDNAFCGKGFVGDSQYARNRAGCAVSHHRAEHTRLGAQHRKIRPGSSVASVTPDSVHFGIGGWPQKVLHPHCNHTPAYQTNTSTS